MVDGRGVPEGVLQEKLGDEGELRQVRGVKANRRPQRGAARKNVVFIHYLNRDGRDRNGKALMTTPSLC